MSAHRHDHGAGRAARADPAGRPRHDGGPRRRAQEGDGAASRAAGSPRPTSLRRAVQQGALTGVKGFGKKTEENILRGLERLQASGGRVQIGIAMDVAESLLGELERLPQVTRAAYAGSLRRMARHDRRRGPPRRWHRRRGDHGGVHVAGRGRRGPGAGRDQVLDRHPEGAAGRSTGRRAAGLGRRDDLFHRLEGAQHPDSRDRRATRSQALRVRAVRREGGHADRGRDRGGRLRPPRVAVDPADPSRGSRRGRGGAGRGAAVRSSRSRTSRATCTRIPTSRTASPRSSRCSRGRSRWDTRTTR